LAALRVNLGPASRRPITSFSAAREIFHNFISTLFLFLVDVD